MSRKSRQVSSSSPGGAAKERRRTTAASLGFGVATEAKRSRPAESFSPSGLLRRAGDSLIKAAFRVISCRRRRPAESAIPQRSSIGGGVGAGDSYRSEAIEDCIEFISRNSVDSRKNDCVFSQYNMNVAMFDSVE